MARILAVEVEQIYATGQDRGDLKPYIETAHMLVNEELLGKGLSEARLREIEKYLAAHFAVVSYEKGGLIRQKVGEAEEEYQATNRTTTPILGLTATRYGQQAVLLDTTGTLGAISQKPVKALFRVVEGPCY
jgi:hypothetical protein